MEFQYLGQSGLRVSRICLGTMNFGESTDKATAEQILHAAREAQVNFLDTADAYQRGASEEIVGELVAEDRDHWVLATKVGQQDGPAPRKMGLSRKWIMSAIDASLKRLRTDYIDIYYMHHRDRDTPLGESIRAMGDVIASGKATYWGFSNFFGWEIAEIIRLCDALGVPRPVVAQPMYNLTWRLPENDYLPACAHFGIGVAAFSPLGRGVLTGKYKQAATPPADSRAARGDRSLLNRDFQPETFRTVELIRDHAAERGMSAADFALRWALHNEIVTSVIAGPRTLEQWHAYLAALGHDFTAEDEEFANRLVPPGHPAAPGLNWSRHPPLGRRPRTG